MPLTQYKTGFPHILVISVNKWTLASLKLKQTVTDTDSTAWCFSHSASLQDSAYVKEFFVLSQE